MFWKKYLPAYPDQARRARMQGSGVFRMYIDENGVVTKIG
jgi:outer membrane biosynthesis protein TonB